MRTHFFYGALRKSIIQFLDVFNDISIAKYDSDGAVISYVNVPVKYMPKSKWYAWVNDRKDVIRTPSIGIELTDVMYDQERSSGLMDTIDISVGDGTKTFTANVSPFNLTFELHIATKYQHEMDQIQENILPWFNPMIYTKVSMDELNLEWDMPIILEDATISTDTDIAENEYRNIHWTHSYLCKTNLVKPVSNGDIVHKVVNKIYLTEESLANRDTTTDMPSGVGKFDEEILVIGSKIDGEIIAKYQQYGDNI